jgi:DNA-directed RNA polymerase subunit omega
LTQKAKIEQALAVIGGRFKLTSLLQKRVRELNRGASRLVQSDTKELLDVALEEIIQGKITLFPPEPEEKEGKKKKDKKEKEDKE